MNENVCGFAGSNAGERRVEARGPETGVAGAGTEGHPRPVPQERRLLADAARVRERDGQGRVGEGDVVRFEAERAHVDRRQRAAHGERPRVDDDLEDAAPAALRHERALDLQAVRQERGVRDLDARPFLDDAGRAGSRSRGRREDDVLPAEDAVGKDEDGADQRLGAAPGGADFVDRGAAARLALGDEAFDHAERDEEDGEEEKDDDGPGQPRISHVRRAVQDGGLPPCSGGMGAAAAGRIRFGEVAP